MSLLVWLITTLIAIAFVGDNAYVALVIAGLGGVAVGLNVLLEPSQVTSCPQHKNPITSSTQHRDAVCRYGWTLDIVAATLLVLPSRWIIRGFLLVPFSRLLQWRAQGRELPMASLNVPVLQLLLIVALACGLVQTSRQVLFLSDRSLPV